MSDPSILIDSNVLIAGLAAPHLHHIETADWLELVAFSACAVAAHSIAEAFSNLTRHGAGGLGFPPDLALAGINDLIADMTSLSLTAAQTLGAIEEYGRSGGIGPRLYDKLIGQVALIHNIPLIITWNVKHMAPLFPLLKVVTPTQFIKES